MTRAFVKLVVLVALSSVAPSLRAQVSADEPAAATQGDPAKMARDRYNAGLQAYQSRRFREAALHFEAASAAVTSAIALYTAGTAWELSDQPERAADDFARCLALPNLPQDKANNARDRLAALQTVLGRVEVTAPDGWRVQLDSNTELPTPAVLHGSAGTHTITGRSPDKQIDRRTVTLTIGQAVKVELTPPPEVKKEPPPSEPVKPPSEPVKPASPSDSSSGSTFRRGLGFGAIGFGGAALVSGIVLGLQANGARDAYNARPSQEGFDHANALATWTTVAFIGGAVFVAGGVALVIWPASKPSGPAHEAPPEKNKNDDVPPTSPIGRRVPSGSPIESLVIAPTLGGAVVRGTF